MRYFRLAPGLKAWFFVFSAAAFLASGTARAATQYLVIQPIDVCASNGTGCAPFNTLSSTGNPAAATTSTPIGFVDPTTNINNTRAIWLPAGIDVLFLPIKQYNSPANSAFPPTDYRTLHVSCTTTPPLSCSSPDFMTLSFGQPSGFPSPAPPVAPPTVNAINMFFVNTLSAVSGISNPLYGFAWIGGDGVAVAKNTFFPPFPVKPRFDTMAHEIGHNLNLDHTTFGNQASPSYDVMTAGSNRMIPNSSGCSTSSGGALYELDTLTIFDCPVVPATPLADQLNPTQEGEVLLSGFLNPIPNVSANAGGGGDLPFTVTYEFGGRTGGITDCSTSTSLSCEYVVRLVITLPVGFEFGNNLFTQTTGSGPQAQVFGTPQELDGDNSQGNSNSQGDTDRLEILFVPGSFRVGTSISFTTDIVDANGVPVTPATISQLLCATPAPPGHCLKITFDFSDLYETTSRFDQFGNANSRSSDATATSKIFNPANLPNIAPLDLTFIGFIPPGFESQIPCTTTQADENDGVCPTTPTAGLPGPD